MSSSTILINFYLRQSFGTMRIGHGLHITSGAILPMTCSQCDDCRVEVAGVHHRSVDTFQDIVHGAIIINGTSTVLSSPMKFHPCAHGKWFTRQFVSNLWAAGRFCRAHPNAVKRDAGCESSRSMATYFSSKERIQP